PCRRDAGGRHGLARARRRAGGARRRGAAARSGAAAVMARPGPLWIFGYGSLLWRPGFPFEEQRAALVRGFARRLAQGSPDHRGTPERLGRVATLEPAPGAE